MRRALFWTLLVGAALVLALGGVVVTRTRAIFGRARNTVPARA